MTGSECMVFANRPDRIGGLTPVLIFDGATINRIDNIRQGTSTPRPGAPAQDWNEDVIADVLTNHPGAQNTIIVNEEGLASITFLQSDAMIDKGLGDLAKWLKLVNKHKQKKARVALDLSTITAYTMGGLWQYGKLNAANYRRRMRMISDRLRGDVLPLVGAVAVQAFYTQRWGDFTKDLFGDGNIAGAFQTWQGHFLATTTLTTLPTIALFSPMLLSLDENRFKNRLLNDDEWNQAMFYLSSYFDEMCFWGSVEQGKPTSPNWYPWDAGAPWLDKVNQYFDKDGNFITDARWPVAVN